MYLNKQVQKALEHAIGISISRLSEMDVDEENNFVRSRVGHQPVFSKTSDVRMRGRGNPLIARRRICTMDDIDKRIMELK